MSKTITIVRSDGRKVRTVRSRRYYVTTPAGGNDNDKAWVAKRTDNISAAYREATRQGTAVEVYDVRAERFIPLAELERSHLAVLRRKRAERAANRGYNPNLF